MTIALPQIEAIVVAILAAALNATTFAVGGEAMSSEMKTMSELSVGQVWSATDISPDVEILIGRFDEFDGIQVVSIRVSNAPTPLQVRPMLEGRETTTIQHMPIESNALRKELKELLRTGEAIPQDFESGYEYWKNAEGGYFAIPLSEALDNIFSTIALENKK